MCIDHYDYDPGHGLDDCLDEDENLVTILATREFPNLKSVLVPSVMINHIYQEIHDPTIKRKFLSQRKLLKEAQIFEKGVVQLRYSKAMEIREFEKRINRWTLKRF